MYFFFKAMLETAAIWILVQLLGKLSTLTSYCDVTKYNDYIGVAYRLEAPFSLCKYMNGKFE